MTRRPFTSFGRSSGCACNIRATAPLVIAVLNDEPVPTKLAAPMRADGFWSSTVEPGARRLMTERPDAIRSGLKTPRTVGPTLLKLGTESSVGITVPLSSSVPTVTTRGSSPGEVIVPFAGPELPAETTTTMPAFQAFSTARSSGSSAGAAVGTALSERLSTRMSSAFRLAITHWMPLTTVATLVTPEAPATFTETRPARGASPRYAPPEEIPLPAIRPATNVPCP